MKTDIAIIGAGPAGISAALNLKLRGADFMLFGTGMSEKVLRSEKISNYPGLPDIGGSELAAKLLSHLNTMGITMTDDMITAIYSMDGKFYLLGKEQQYEAKCVIIATGVQAGKQLNGEAELLGSGVSYCATCDGMLYKGKRIAVLCDSEELEHEVDYLANIAEKVYYRPLFKNAKVQGDNIEYVTAGFKSIDGDMRVRSVTLTDGSSIEVDGVFLLKKCLPPDALLRGLKTDDGHISVDRRMNTSIESCYGAGDCTGRPYQLAKATGEGNIAAHSALERLSLYSHLT